MVPLFILTMFIPVFMSADQMNALNQQRDEILLFKRVIQRKFGLMTPVGTSDSVHVDYDAVQAVLDDIPNAYVSDVTASSSAATVSKFKSFLSGTDRAHIAAHGSWSSGPSVALYDDDLTSTLVNGWTTQGPRCKLIILSACDSMGHDDTQDNQLATAIIAKSGVQQVIGYNDEVGSAGAANFAAYFWNAHLWENGASGGVSSNDAFDNAKDLLFDLMANTALEAELNSYITGVLLGVLFAILALILPESVLVDIAIMTIVHDFMFAQLSLWVNSISSAYHHVVKYGSSVAGLTYSGGGGGGGDVPF